MFLPPRDRGIRVELLPDSRAVPEHITEIQWKHGHIMVAEWLKRFGEFGVDYYGTFRNRTTLDTVTGRLVINNMTVEDIGVYSLKINNKNHNKTYLMKEMSKCSWSLWICRCYCLSFIVF